MAIIWPCREEENVTTASCRSSMSEVNNRHAAYDTGSPKRSDYLLGKITSEKDIALARL